MLTKPQGTSIFTYSTGWSTFSNGLVAGRCRASSAECHVYNSISWRANTDYICQQIYSRTFSHADLPDDCTVLMSALTNFDRLIVVRVLRDFSVGFVMVCRVVACLGSVEVPELVTTLFLRCSSGGAVCDFVLVVTLMPVQQCSRYRP